MPFEECAEPRESRLELVAWAAEANLDPFGTLERRSWNEGDGFLGDETPTERPSIGKPIRNLDESRGPEVGLRPVEPLCLEEPLETLAVGGDVGSVRRQEIRSLIERLFGDVAVKRRWGRTNVRSPVLAGSDDRRRSTEPAEPHPREAERG